MKKIGLVTSPLSSGHAVRGVGFYTARILPELIKQASSFDLSITQIQNPGDIYSANIDLVHYPFFDSFLNTLPIFKSLPTVVTIHDLIPWEYPEIYPAGLRGGINAQLQKLSLLSVSRVITDSHASLKAVLRLTSVPHSRLRLVYLAADPVFKPVTDTALLGRVAKKYALPEKFILFVGDINWNKNLSGLASAAIESGYPLVIVGKQAKQAESMNSAHAEHRHLPELLKQLKNPLIHRLGFVPDQDLVCLYSLATIYSQPSFAEGFGLPVLEAMACGTPVACSNTHSLPEIAGESAVYFNPYLSEEIVSSLKSLWTDIRLRTKLKESGLQQSAKFSWKSAAENTLRVYREII
jgi:glycosyltransferase involved in cell wall biosynthesis